MIYKYIAITLLLINGMSAMGGGILLVARPNGQILRLSTDLLAHSPFSDFLIPGLVLIFFNGLSSLVLAIITIVNSKPSPYFIIAQGIFLTLWIIIQVLMIRTFDTLQIIFGLIGLLIIFCGIKIKDYLDKEKKENQSVST
ncbi:MAG TPA: hypothetical protein DEP28_09400 [Bacteroidetes bacterium]|nr:hypothetical protein [Bacteroidota bacterium]HCN38119.1 hypothetical protein [Bacteroidota bacterium]